MLTITEDDAHNCLVLEPSGPLTRRDLDALTERFDARVNATDRVPEPGDPRRELSGLGGLRGAPKAPALHPGAPPAGRAGRRRFGFPRARPGAARLARHFVSAEVRHFAAADFQAALAWVGEDPPDRSHVTLIEGLPDDVLGISVAGIVTARDYAETIVPAIEARLAAHPKLRLLYRIGPDFEAFTPGAVWSDALIGVKHLTDFSRVAVVSDIGWIRHAARAFAPMIPAEVHVFADDALAEAKAWLAASVRLAGGDQVLDVAVAAGDRALGLADHRPAGAFEEGADGRARPRDRRRVADDAALADRRRARPRTAA